MIYVSVIGDREFIRDTEVTRAKIPHYMMSMIEDMQSSIARLARQQAPGRLGDESVGSDPVFHAEGNYRGVVGVRPTPLHAKFVHEGTGVFGPKGVPYTLSKRPENPAPNFGVDRTGRINPAVGNVFKISDAKIGGNLFFFRREVTIKGQRAQPYLTEAFRLAEHTEVPLRVLRLVRQLTS